MTNRQLSKLYEIPKTPREGKETTGKEELQLLYEATGDEVFEKVIEIRSLDQNLNNFIPNWEPWADGRVHTVFGYRAPSGQFDSRRPNILNCSKHTDAGQEFRGIIETVYPDLRQGQPADTGKIFVELDYRRFHVSTMGYCAMDPSYIRFAKLDSHTIFTSQIVPEVQAIDMSWSDSHIIDAAKEVKKAFPEVRQKRAKPVVLGNQLGLGPKKLWMQNRKYIHSMKEAAYLQALIAMQFSLPHMFKDRIREKAHIQTFLINEWGVIQYFYNVYSFRWDPVGQQWRRNAGKDSERAIAFPVQSTAFGMIKWNLLHLQDQHDALEEFGFNISLHDSVGFECEVAKLEKCIATVKPIMERPCTVLANRACPEGLQVNVDVSIGKNWKKYDKETNPEGMREIEV